MRGRQGFDRADVGDDRLPDDALEQRHLVLEVEVDRRLAETGARGDVVETGGCESLLDEFGQCRLEDFLRPVGRRPALLLLPRRHKTNLPVSKSWNQRKRNGALPERLRPVVGPEKANDQLYLAISSRPTWSRWTSSGPSARRKVR